MYFHFSQKGGYYLKDRTEFVSHSLDTTDLILDIANNGFNVRTRAASMIRHPRACIFADKDNIIVMGCDYGGRKVGEVIYFGKYSIENIVTNKYIDRESMICKGTYNAKEDALYFKFSNCRVPSPRKGESRIYYGELME